LVDSVFIENLMLFERQTIVAPKIELSAFLEETAMPHKHMHIL